MIGQLSMRYQGIYCWCLLWQTTRFYGPCNNPKTWWRHQMETFSALLALCAGNSPVPSQRPVTRSFDVLFDLRMNKRSNKQSWGCHRAHYDVTLMNPGKESRLFDKGIPAIGKYVRCSLLWSAIRYRSGNRWPTKNPWSSRKPYRGICWSPSMSPVGSHNNRHWF